jgi:curved DNA-binding protein CbpA
MARTHYTVLGVPRSESEAGIRAAFRDLVKRHHPDRSGSAVAERFREIVEAYGVLSDPERRRRYDDSLSEPVAVRATAPWPPAEPLVPRPPSIFSRPEPIRPAYEEIRDRRTSRSGGIGAPEPESLRAIDVEVVLDSLGVGSLLLRALVRVGRLG